MCTAMLRPRCPDFTYYCPSLDQSQVVQASSRLSKVCLARAMLSALQIPHPSRNRLRFQYVSLTDISPLDSCLSADPSPPLRLLPKHLGRHQRSMGCTLPPVPVEEGPTFHSLQNLWLYLFLRQEPNDTAAQLYSMNLQLLNQTLAQYRLICRAPQWTRSRLHHNDANPSLLPPTLPHLHLPTSFIPCHSPVLRPPVRPVRLRSRWRVPRVTAHKCLR